MTARTRRAILDTPDGKLLAIDFGEKRVGLAVSVPGTSLALPLIVLERRSDRQIVAEIAEIVVRERVAGLVLGEPLGPVGHPGTAAERVRRFGAKLQRTVALPIVWIDESLTSVEATERMRGPGSRSRSSDGIDAVAAQILLEEALARQPNRVQQAPSNPT